MNFYSDTDEKETLRVFSLPPGDSKNKAVDNLSKLLGRTPNALYSKYNYLVKSKKKAKPPKAIKFSKKEGRMNNTEVRFPYNKIRIDMDTKEVVFVLV